MRRQSLRLLCDGYMAPIVTLNYCASSPRRHPWQCSAHRRPLTEQKKNGKFVCETCNGNVECALLYVRFGQVYFFGVAWQREFLVLFYNTNHEVSAPIEHIAAKKIEAVGNI